MRRKAWIRYALFGPLAALLAVLMVEAASLKTLNWHDGSSPYLVYRGFGVRNLLVMRANRWLMTARGFHLISEYWTGRELEGHQLYSDRPPVVTGSEAVTGHGQ